MFECRKVPDERGAWLVDLNRVAVDAALRYLDPLHRGGSGGTAARVAPAVTLVAVQRGAAPALRPQYTAEWQRTLDGCPRGRSQCPSSAFNSQSYTPIDASTHEESSSGSARWRLSIRLNLQGGRCRPGRCGTRSVVVPLFCQRGVSQSRYSTLNQINRTQFDAPPPGESNGGDVPQGSPMTLAVQGARNQPQMRQKRARSREKTDDIITMWGAPSWAAAWSPASLAGRSALG